MHATYANAAPFQFVMEQLRKSANGKLARAVCELARHRRDSQNAGKVHDVCSRLAFQQRQEIFHSVDRAPEIDIHQPAKIVERNFFKISMQHGAGVVDEQRDAPVPRVRVRGKNLCAFFFGHIDNVRRDQGDVFPGCVPVAAFRKRLRRLLELGFVDVRQRQRGTRGRQLLRECPSYA